MKWLALPWFAGLVLLGCASAVSETSVQADGSFYRRVTLELATSVMEEEPDIRTKFVLPEEGVDVKTQDGKMVATFERPYAADSGQVTDIQCLHDGKVALVNEITVRRIDGGLIEFREVFRRVGQPARLDPKDRGEVVAAMRSALPAKVSDAKVEQVTDKVMLAVVRMMFGPPEPLMTSAMVMPAFGGRRITSRIYETVLTTLKTDLASEMSLAECEAAARSMLEDPAFNLTRNATPEPPRPTDAENNSLIVMITSAVKGPGKLVRTNGIHDPFSGEVVWALFSQSAEAANAELIAVFDPGPTDSLLRRQEKAR
ncbi:MAG: hypothetical protein ACK4XJ_02105 [Fimbriimonadaceae bacterium]